MSNTVLIAGGGISGILSAYHVSKMCRGGVNIEIIEPSSVGGEFLSNVSGPRWFYYTPLMEELLKELGMQYEVVQQTGGVLWEGEVRIFPDYAKANPKVIESYYNKTRGKGKEVFDVKKYNGMNEVQNNATNHRLILLFNEGLLLSKLLTAVAKNSVVRYTNGYLTRINHLLKYAEVLLRSGETRTWLYDQIVITIPLHHFIQKIWMDPPKSIKSIMLRKKLDSNWCVDIAILGFEQSSRIWWDYVFVPERNRLSRRIVFRREKRREPVFVMDVMHRKLKQYLSVSGMNEKGKRRLSGDLRDALVGFDIPQMIIGEPYPIKGFVDDLDLDSYIMPPDIYFFGRYAKWNHNLTVDRTYQQIINSNLGGKCNVS